MDSARPGPPGTPANGPAWFHRYRHLALPLAILVSDLSFFSNIIEPSCTWWQRLLEAGWAVLGYAALRWRTSAPVLAYGAGWCYSAGAALLTILGVFTFTPFFALLFSLAAIASERPLRISRWALATALVPVALAIWYNVQSQAANGYQASALIASAVFYLVITAVAWSIGRRSRSVREAEELHRRRLALASEAVQSERLRIARELHDILAHTVTVMVLQASGARRVLAVDPARADEALGRVEEVGKTAMDELRRMLALIRSPELNSGVPGQNGVAEIGTLLDVALKAGVAARLEVRGAPLPVVESMDRTVYRVVQEGITNIVRHAGPGTVALVRLTWDTDLHIEIIDDGGGTPLMEANALSTGHGLLGLAERVAVFGGALAAGPHRSGFRLHASLPLRQPQSTYERESNTQEIGQ